MNRWIAKAWIMPAALLFIHAGGAAHAAQSAPAPNAAELFSAVNRGMSDIDRDLRKQANKARLLQNISDVRQSLEKLKNIPPAKGDATLYRQYCEISVGILNDVETQVNHSYWTEAVKSFERIDDLKRDLNRDFRPGKWARFKSWWKRIF